MSSLLLIAPRDPSETVMATGVFAWLRAAAAEATIICRPEARALFRADAELSLRDARTGPAAFRDWCALGWRHALNPFDIIADFEGKAGARAIMARRRITRRPAKTLRHLVEEFSELAGAEAPLSPMIVPDAAARAAAAAAARNPAPLLVIAPGGAEFCACWPLERFAAIARRLADAAFAERAQIAILGAGEFDAELARSLAASLDADAVPAHSLVDKFDLLEAAALCERAALTIGNDNVWVHLAAAMGAPALALFGPSDERVRAPWGPRARALRVRPFAEIASAAHSAAHASGEQRSWLDDISVDAVEAAAHDMMRAGGLR